MFDYMKDPCAAKALEQFPPFRCLGVRVLLLSGNSVWTREMSIDFRQPGLATWSFDLIFQRRK
jgi:hypothetical protein